MYSLAELARVHTGLREPEIDHLQRLVADWGLLADLSFSDLLLYAACNEEPAPGEGRVGRRSPKRGYVALAQVRPSTTQTVYQRDLVGAVTSDAERPLIDRTFRGGEITSVDNEGSALGERLQVVGLPVRLAGQVIGVVTSEGLPSGGRRHGELEKAYLSIFERFARMIALGEFPYPAQGDGIDEGPRVGDGVVLLDREGRLCYSSPNANSALHRLGVLSNLENRTLSQLGLDDAVVRQAAATRRRATAELARGTQTHVLVHCLPLLERGAIVGDLLLLRDISDLKRLDRLLVSKDTHIREIHHRVKNNLQTISSLLRIQARRLGSDEARRAIEESVRRIGSIAVVHETLSREAGDDVPFAEIARPIIRMVEDSLTNPERPIFFALAGDTVTLPAQVATPLALVLTELLQNTVDHAYPADAADTAAAGEVDRSREGGAAGRVVIELRSAGNRVRVTVRDDGAGLPEGFSLDGPTGLGLSIVRTLVEQELFGTITMRRRDDGEGTEVVVDVPLDASH